MKLYIIKYLPMHSIYSKFKKFISLFGILLIIYVFIRILFIYHVSAAGSVHLSFIYYLNYIWKGLRFDVSSLCMINSLFILLYFFPLNQTGSKKHNKVLALLFIITNAFGLLVSCADIVYYPFVQKRIQAETFMYLTGQKGDEVYTVLPLFIKENWSLVVLFVLFIYLLVKTTFRALVGIPESKFKKQNHIGAIAGYLLLIGFSILGIRGGIQNRPLEIVYASEMVPASEVQYILSSPFTILKSIGKNSLPEVQHYPVTKFNICDLPIHSPNAGNNFQKKNVVVLIIESLGRNYLSYFNGSSKTPFIDSIFRESLVFQNAYANAKESTQGVTAVVASIPSWQDEPYIFSKYATNNIQSFASILKPLGYSTYFLHGATKGSMGFDGFAYSAGFDQFIPREDFPDQSQYDGPWGIWDEPFLKHMASKLNQTKEPFLSVFFSLSTHHPFNIPSKFESTFTINGHPVNKTVQYADYALRHFFDSIKHTSWFSNTLFVITADHTGPNTAPNFNNKIDMSIPIVFYTPDGSLKGVRDDVASQIDILPSVLDLLHYNKPYFALGKSLFTNDCEKYSINFKAGLYNCYSKSYCYQFNGEKCVGFFDLNNDTLLKKNLLNNKKYSAEILAHEEFIKKSIQIFNHSMIKNALTVNRFLSTFK